MPIFSNLFSLNLNNFLVLTYQIHVKKLNFPLRRYTTQVWWLRFADIKNGRWIEKNHIKARILQNVWSCDGWYKNRANPSPLDG